MPRLVLFLLLLLAGPALGQPLPVTKPPPLGAAVMPPAETATPGTGEAGAQRCAAPLAQGCLRMQSTCQVACPPMWSTNPSAPAFTPTDRAGCMQRCFQQYLACQRQYAC